MSGDSEAHIVFLLTGRPRKHWPPPLVKLEPDAPQQQEQPHILGSTIDMESDHMDPTDFTQAEKHNLLITFQQPETGEMVITMLPPPPPSSAANPTTAFTTSTSTTTTSVTTPTSTQPHQQQLLDDHSVPDEIVPEGHRCDQCGEVIQFKRDYIRHLRQKHDLRPYECDQCGKTCTSNSALEAHHRVHGLERPHRCDYCGKGFLDPSHLKTHVLTHTGERPHRCHHCFKAFAQASQLKKHLALHQDGHQYRCSICGRTFAHRDTLYTHVKTHTSSRPFICDICSLGFVTSSGLNRHRKVHKRSSESLGGLEDEFKCTVCQANFTYKRTLTKHMTAVHGDGPPIKEEEADTKPFQGEVSLVEQLQEQLNEGYAPKTSELYDEPKQSETLESKFPTNPFKCGICEESFTDVDVLCDHYTNSHTGDQEVYCDVCSVGCASEQQLEQHKRLHLFEEQQSIIHTIPTDEFPFVCAMCGKSFRKHQEFKRHHRGHTQEKNYKCDLCDAGFPLKSALDKHVLVHTGERPFKCDICLKSFRQSAALVRHKLWTHRLKNQNKCELCGKTFFTPTLLTYHLDSHGDAGQSAKSRMAELAEDEEQQLLEQPGEAGEEEGRSEGKEGVKSWKCDICKKAFATKLTLIRHSHVHLREALRPGPGLALIPEEGEEGEMTGASTLPSVLKCDDCGIDFAHKSHYVRHKLLHSGTPLLKCGLCNKLFVHKSDIIRHKQYHNTTMDIEAETTAETQLYMCDICGRVFDKKKYLYTHQNVHSRQRNFPCNYCGKQLASRLALKNHYLIHTGEMPYKYVVQPLITDGRAVRMGLRVNIIVAVSENYGIGKGGELPWKLRGVTLVKFVVGLCLFIAVTDFTNGDRVKHKIYQDIQGDMACFKRFNGTHEIGCTSKFYGNLGVVHVVASSEDLTWVFEHGPHQPYVLALYPEFMTVEVLQQADHSGKVSGIILMVEEDFDPATSLYSGFSGETPCPNEGLGMYTPSLNPEYAGYCQNKPWNTNGTSLLYMNWDFPIFLIDNQTSINHIIDCYKNFNEPDADGTARSWPLCYSELKSNMFGTTNTEVCMRRRYLAPKLQPVNFCDPLSDFNIWGTLKPMNSSDVVPEKSVIIVATRMDATSMFDNISPGANSAVSGLVSSSSCAFHSLLTIEAMELPSNRVNSINKRKAADNDGDIFALPRRARQRERTVENLTPKETADTELFDLPARTQRARRLLSNQDSSLIPPTLPSPIQETPDIAPTPTPESKTIVTTVKEGLSSSKFIDREETDIVKDTDNTGELTMSRTLVIVKPMVKVQPIVLQTPSVKSEDSRHFDEVDDDVQDLLESHAEPLSNDELIELARQEAEKEGDKEEEPVCGLKIKTLKECLGGIEKALKTLKECNPNPARSSKVAHDEEKSVKIYQEIYDEKTRKNKQSSIYSFFKPVRQAIPVAPADPPTAGPSTSVADGSTAGSSSISSFFKPVKCANPATAGPSTYASDSADDNVLSSSAHSAEDE
ncbi:Zinc finger protein 808 [Portunus trituberculatus]|uniref:Zinc finger protein 808 n=1 Tax=Portunus trituberculatus TaxID=210409 RepID=A0A5B7DTB0_PORTR|nr:Zinc finger protein 808 [Portunus trituberculatus]